MLKKVNKFEVELDQEGEILKVYLEGVEIPTDIIKDDFLEYLNEQANS